MTENEPAGSGAAMLPGSNDSGIELITVRDGRVAVKDVYWKQPGRG